MAIVEEKIASSGLVEFVPSLAEIQFKESLKYHLRLEDGSTPNILKPLPNSFLDQPVTIKFIQYFDDSNTVFPYIFKNPSEGIVQPLDGPSVIALIEAQSLLPLAGSRRTIKRLAVYEYRK